MATFNFHSSFLKGFIKSTLLIAVTSIYLTGCDTGPNQQQKLATALALTPDNPEINEIYQRTCKACHTQLATGAPLTGDKTAWAERLEKGQAVLLNSVIEGAGGMPPFGLCMECDAEQFEALINFMAQE